MAKKAIVKAGKVFPFLPSKYGPIMVVAKKSIVKAGKGFSFHTLEIWTDRGRGFRRRLSNSFSPANRPQFGNVRGPVARF